MPAFAADSKHRFKQAMALLLSLWIVNEEGW
jgi:hypothetical protein